MFLSLTDQKLQSRFEQAGVLKIVCSHMRLRHLILLTWTKEPEVYTLSAAHGSRKSLLDQSDRSTQIVLSIGLICLAICTFVRPSSIATSKMASDVFLNKF